MNEESRLKIVKLLKGKTLRFLSGVLSFSLILAIDAFVLRTMLIASIFYFSVICTAGAGLLFWIPLAYAIGGVLCDLIIFIFFHSVKTYSNEHEESLDQFITGAKDKGFAKDKVISLLINAGWKESQYKAVLDKYYS